MRRQFKVILGLAAAALLLSACSQSSGHASKDVKHVGILQYVELEPLDAAREGFIKELEKHGYKDGKTIEIDYQNAQGDQSSLPTMSEKLVSDNDIVLGIATQPYLIQFLQRSLNLLISLEVALQEQPIWLQLKNT